MNFKEKMYNLKIKISQVYLCMKSPLTPWYAKVIAAMTVAYALSPIDLIPDFIPLLGYLDDLIILPLLIYITMKLVPKETWKSFEDKAKEIWKDGKTKRWYYSLPIIFIWLMFIGLIIYFIMK